MDQSELIVTVVSLISTGSSGGKSIFAVASVETKKMKDSDYLDFPVIWQNSFFGMFRTSVVGG